MVLSEPRNAAAASRIAQVLVRPAVAVNNPGITAPSLVIPRTGTASDCCTTAINPSITGAISGGGENGSTADIVGRCRSPNSVQSLMGTIQGHRRRQFAEPTPSVTHPLNR